ncbi:succinyldiaminopimelate transaminase [Brevibacterium daeguense]|uniref:succinyldiaminopimelate transaminase n=1 Tax=Brevibacterium daeguense TaxID=909936 RepID=UPI001EFF6D63|nr:succinyldiaminopimelate transaminase [Brevibacterium daeguense]
MLGLALPDYPWDTLTPYRLRAADHAGGVCDLSIGTPVDPTPSVIREALAAGADSHGYPTTAGTPQLREAIAFWYSHWHGIELDPATQVLPTIGSKELVAWLPTLLGLRQAGLSVACPAAAYPTYEMGATLAGVDCVRLDAGQVLAGASLEGIGLLWLNSPSNPTGEVLPREAVAEVVERARAAGVVVASDECYGLLNWAADAPAPSVLDPAVTGGDHSGVLAVYSMSKQSNLAGYRAAFTAGDPALIGSLTNSRKHAGMIVPGPVQTAMVAGLHDVEHVRAQKEVYRRRREVLMPAVAAFGLRIDHSTAGLYLWATRDEDCWTTIGALADLGIVAGPGAFYGDAARRHVRIALTAPDERIGAAAERLLAAA